jgi:MFS family permease
MGVRQRQMFSEAPSPTDLDGTSISMKARHTVLSILFVTWIVSSVDRMAMSVALPYISTEFRLSSVESGVLLSAFFAGYSISQIPGGVLADSFGVRRVATAAMVWWSLFTAITGLVGNLVQMLVTRFVFGLGEGVFPSCAFKTIAVWFPRRERATANAIMLASNPLGVALSPLVVVAIMSVWGWRAVFYSLFLPGVIIALLFWIFIPNSPADSRRVSTAELAEIEHGDPPISPDAQFRPGFIKAISQPQILRYFLILFTFDISFWGFTSWLPTYLVKERGFSMIEMGGAASLPFFAGTLGSIVGGWLSDRYYSRHRKWLIIAVELSSAALLYLSFTASSVMLLLIFQSLAGFFLLAFFSTFWALPMNSVPKVMMGITSGTINMAGQIAAFVAPMLMGFLAQAYAGDFRLTTMILVGSLLLSAAIVLTIPDKRHAEGEAPIA